MDPVHYGGSMGPVQNGGSIAHDWNLRKGKIKAVMNE